MSGSVEKPCVYCGLSCAGEPRIKSADGKYAHKSCAQARGEAKAKTPAKAGSAPSGAIPVEGEVPMAAFLDDLPDPTAAAAEGRCGGCGAALGEGNVICMKCGFDTRTGAKAMTTVKNAPRDVGGSLGGVGSLGAKAGGMALTPFFPIIGACVGGAIGAAGWAAIAYGTGYEIGFIATIVGAICGIGAFMGSRGEGGIWAGCVAVVVALCSIGAGKMITFDIYMQDLADELEAAQSEYEDRAAMLGREDYEQYIADEIVEARLDAGEAVDWPDPEMTVEYAYFPEDYPDDIIEETRVSYDSMSSSERDAYAEAMLGNIDEAIAALRSHDLSMSGQTMIESLNLFDALWGFLALGAAWGIGSGGSMD